MKLVVMLLALTGVSYAGEGEYSYEKQDAWPGVCTRGKNQSPIDVNEIVDTVYYHESLPIFGHGGELALKFDESAHMTMKFDIVPKIQDTSIKMPFNWPVGHTKGLDMLQIHFHWGSDWTNGAEHHLFGTQYQGEIHLVTRNLDQDDPAKDDYYAVLGLFIEEVELLEEVAGKTDEHSPGAFVDKVSSPGYEGEVVLLNDLYSRTSLTSVYTYEGSLTTPTCNEHVFWQVFETPVKVSNAVMNRLRSHTGHANYREPQALNGRKITHRLLKQLFDSPEKQDDGSPGGGGECKVDCYTAQEQCNWSPSAGILSTLSATLALCTALLVYW